MADKISTVISEYFSELKDPRIDRTKLHQLLDIVTITVCAVICNADTWEDIEEFGHSKEHWLRTFLALENGIPSHDTFRRVFSLLEPEQFQQCFLRWVQAVTTLTQGQVLAVDGKTLRGSADRGQGKSAIHMVSVWAEANRLVLAQTKVADKSNEITAIPELLRLLELSGCIVTIDAMGCQREIAQLIVDQQADYVLAVKENQGHLYRDIEEVFELEFAHAIPFEGMVHDYHKTVDKGHGRLEIRQCWTISDPDSLNYLRKRAAWQGLTCIALVLSERRIGAASSYELRYFISSLPGEARQLLHAVRSHWGIENQLHWQLDVAFREDDSRMRKDHSPENFAVVRHIVLNLLKHERSCRRSIKGKRLKCGWDQHYLLKVLAG